MRSIFSTLPACAAATLVLAMSFALAAPSRAEDLITKPSPHSVKVTLDRLEAALQSKGIKVFARVDHAAGAEATGGQLPPTELLIFGNPKLGTPLMQSNRAIGLDLPMKVLAWEDADGKVYLSYAAPRTLKDRYDIKDRDAVFETMTGALAGFTDAATKAQ